MPEIAMQPDSPGPYERQDLCWNAGYPYPMGPVIPRPNARWQALWPGLLKSNLNRYAAAAEVLICYYKRSDDNPPNAAGTTKPCAGEACWKETRGEMKPRLLLSFCNGLALNGSTAKGVNGPLKILDDWLGKVQYRHETWRFKDLVEDKLKKDFRDSYHAGRNNARSASLLFAPPFYPQVGQDPQCVIGATSWNSTRYGEKTRQHVQKLLLKEPAGEWNLLTLLFVKLLHTHMAWLAPAQIREERRALYYRPLLRQLRLCAEQAGTPHAHPLADTAAGIWQNLRRVNLLLSTDKKNDRSFPLHTDALDPTHDLLPDSLHMGSALWVTECVSEVKQILRWMDDQGGGNEWAALEPWVDEVATLAWEMASARTDPFAMGGLGMVSDNAFKTAHTFKRFTEDWLAHVKGVRARVHQLHGVPLTPKQATSLGQMPSRFKSAFVPDEAPSSEEPNAQVEHTIRAIELWAERPAQLRLFYETTSKMLFSYGLKHFQTQPATPT